MAVTANKALAELEARREKGLAKQKELAGQLKALLDAKDEFLKDNHLRQEALLRDKAREGRGVEAAQRALDRLAARIPQEVDRDLQRREAELRSLELKRRTHERELHGVRHDLERLRKKNVPPDTLKSLREQAEALEGLLAENAEDAEEARKGLEAAQNLRREALEGLAAEAEAELAALGA